MLAEPLTLEQVRSLLADVQLDRLLGLEETAEYLEVPPGQLETWVKERLIPHENVSGLPIFRLREVVRWEVEGRQQLLASPQRDE